MKKDIIILGSTGSIGESTLNILRIKKKDFNVKILSTNSNVKKILNQAIEFNVKNVIIINKNKFLKYEDKFKKYRIKVYFNFKDVKKILSKKVYYCINGISGIDGLEPTLIIIKFCKNIAIANKESIICGWKFIKEKLNKHNTKFLPIDSEHFSTWTLLKGENIYNVDRIFLTASGGPFLKKKSSIVNNAKPIYALKHPNWNMGKKISIDSATMMNKVFEIIEAKRIFDLPVSKFNILIHPNSYIHSIIKFNNGIIKILAHDTSMEIPIINTLYKSEDVYNFTTKKVDYNKLNKLELAKPKISQFPTLKLIKLIPNKFTYFETILITINDVLVYKYLNNEITFSSIYNYLNRLIKLPYFNKYYAKSPRNLNDIKIMISIVKDKIKYFFENAK